MNIEQTIQNILLTIKDPILNKTANELNLKSVISLENSQIYLHLSAGFPCLLLRDSFLPPLTAALQNALPNYQINITLDQFIKAHRTQLTGKGLRGVKNTIAIASGKGGVGKSTVAVNLAISLAKAGARVGLLDADIYGPSIPLMLGTTTEPVMLNGDRYLPIVAHGIYTMSIGYLTQGEQALIWRGPMLAKSLLQMIDITDWDELDYLFIDLPPGTGDIQLSLVQKIPLTGAVVVTTPQNVATLDAQKALNLFEKTDIHVIGLIENMSQHICSNCGHQEAIFGEGGAAELAKRQNIPLLSQLPLNAKIGKDCDEGIPTASASLSSNELADAFMKTAMNIALELNQRPLNYANKFPPIVVEK